MHKAEPCGYRTVLLTNHQPVLPSARSCGKVMFLHLFVTLSTGEGVSASGPGGGVSATPGRHPLGRHSHHWAHPTSMHPSSRHPLGQTPPPTSADTPLGSACWDMVHRWAVRIPLECILVVSVCVCVFLRGLLRTITNIYEANLGGNCS